MSPCVTDKLVIVIEGVTQDIPTKTATKVSSRIDNFFFISVHIIIQNDNYMPTKFAHKPLLIYISNAKSLVISECVKSYGENCKHQCSQHCVNQTCDRFTGKCLSWCKEGFYGEKCNQGYFFFLLLKMLFIYAIICQYVCTFSSSKFCFNLNNFVELL